MGNRFFETLPPRQLLFYVALALTGNNLQIAVPLNIAFEVLGYCTFLAAAGSCYFAVARSERDVWKGLLLGVACWIIERLLDFCVKLLWSYDGVYWWDLEGLALQVGIFSAVGAVFQKRSLYAK